MKKLFLITLLSIAMFVSYGPASIAKDDHGHNHEHGHDDHKSSSSGHHDHGPAHGGQFFEDANHHGVEMVAKGKEVIFHMTVEGKPLDMTGTKFKAIIQINGGTKMHALTSEGSMLKATLEAPLPKGAKIVVTGKDSHGDVLQARFVKE